MFSILCSIDGSEKPGILKMVILKFLFSFLNSGVKIFQK